MEKLKTIASKVMKSINRITSFPVVLVIRALSAAGITRAITRAATRAIRKDRLMRASIFLVSLEVGFLLMVLILMSMGFSRTKTGMEALSLALRMVLIALTAGSMVLFKHSKVSRKHRYGAETRRLARSRKGVDI